MHLKAELCYMYIVHVYMEQIQPVIKATTCKLTCTLYLSAIMCLVRQRHIR